MPHHRRCAPRPPPYPAKSHKLPGPNARCAHRLVSIPSAHKKLPAGGCCRRCRYPGQQAPVGPQRPRHCRRSSRLAPGSNSRGCGWGRKLSSRSRSPWQTHPCWSSPRSPPQPPAGAQWQWHDTGAQNLPGCVSRRCRASLPRTRYPSPPGAGPTAARCP